MDALTEDILLFWFGTTDMSSPIEKRQIWFRSTPDFDRELIENYAEIHERAYTGDLDYLKATGVDCLALIICLDQFPRNIYRGTPRAFSADLKARQLTKFALDNGFDEGWSKWPRIFMYLPLEHSEILADHEIALPLYKAVAENESIKSAQGHYDTIKQFGRFPHRNEVLGRKNTPEEEEYMKNPPTWGKTAAEVEEMERKKAKGKKR
tara:strand:+ start:1862 stop:2485 length:624 start_codon:yes stop_codon:yes gene_type:complete